MTLFDPGPALPPPPPDTRSYTERLTARNRDLLAAGVHPATRRGLLDGDATCATCAHHVVVHVNRRFHKCEKHRLGVSASEASDIRVSWPACVLYVQEDPDE